MISDILAAVDSTLHAEAVIDMATEVAEKFRARVHLFRIVHESLEFPPAAVAPVDTLNDYLLAQARTDLARLAHSHPSVTILEPILSTGEPWKLIGAAAEVIHADLIVIGSHHFGGWDRLFGTTAGKVVNRSGRHVLVVHQPTVANPEGTTR